MLFIHFLVFGLSLVVVTSLEYGAVAYFIGGMLIGTVLRDFGWVRASIKSWPFIKRVINWDEVLRLADDERTAQPADAGSPRC